MTRFNAIIEILLFSATALHLRLFCSTTRCLFCMESHQKVQVTVRHRHVEACHDEELVRKVGGRFECFVTAVTSSFGKLVSYGHECLNK